MIEALANTIDQRKNIEGQITMAVRSPLFKDEVWVLVESETDQKIYKRFFNDKAMVLPAVKDENRKPNCWSVEQIVTSVLNNGVTQYILGIRDTDYTRFWHERKYTLPTNIVHTHHRDIEMTLLSADSCINALNRWDSKFSQNIDECSQYIKYMGYLRVWFDNYGDIENYNLKKFKWGRILCDNSNEIAKDWKQRLTDRFNEISNNNLTVEEAEQYAKDKHLDTLSIYDICRGHDFLLFLSNRMVRTDIYSQNSIREKMSNNYDRREFWSSETGERIKSIASSWKINIYKNF